MGRKLRNIAVLMIGVFPPSIVKNFFFKLTGYSVSRNSKIGIGIYWNLNSIEMRDSAVIGHFNILRNLKSCVLAEYAYIGHFNWITASSELINRGAKGSLAMSESSAVTTRHYLDCSGGISIGKFTTIAGIRSTFFTHGVDWKSSSQQWNEIKIGQYCLLNSNLVIAPGTQIPNNCVVAMGATIVKSQFTENSLITGFKAKEKIENLEGAYFERRKRSV